MSRGLRGAAGWLALGLLTSPALGAQPSDAAAAVTFEDTENVSRPLDDAPTEAEPSTSIDAIEERLQRLEGRVSEAEARLDEAARARALGPSRGARGPGAVLIAAGETEAEAVSFAGPLEIHGRVLGSAVAFGGDVRVFNGAVVQGDAVSFGGRVVVEDGGAVEGNRVTLGQAASGLTGSSLDLRHPDWVQALARRLVVLFSFAGAGVLVVGLFPRQVDTVATTLTAHPLRSGITGLLLTGFACLLTLIFAVTLIGIPIALFIAVVIAIAALLGFIALCQAAGDHIPWSNQGARRWLAFLMGVVGLGLLGSLPFIGKAALAALGLSCMGAALQTRLGTREWVD